MNIENSSEYSHMNSNLLYIEESVPGYGINEEDFNFCFDVHCQCFQSCTNEKCRCVSKFGVNYKDNGCLIDEKLLNSNHNIVECSFLCQCNDNCGNKITQNGPNKYLKIIDVQHKGHGVIATSIIEKGSFICEYAGEIIDKKEAIKRSKYENSKYILTLREHCSTDVIETFVDATEMSNIGRYVNHCCDPNCLVIAVRIGRVIPKLCIFANKNVEAGEEISYSYGSNGSLSDTICYCGSKKCCGFLPKEDF